MECSCECPDDLDLPECIRALHRTARKEHICCECGDKIPPGARYEHIRGLWDGHWMDFKTCTICERIRDDLCPGMLGGLRQHILECLGLDYVTGHVRMAR